MVSETINGWADEPILEQRGANCYETLLNAYGLRGRMPFFRLSERAGTAKTACTLSIQW